MRKKAINARKNGTCMSKFSIIDMTKYLAKVKIYRYLTLLIL